MHTVEADWFDVAMSKHAQALSSLFSYKIRCGSTTLYEVVRPRWNRLSSLQHALENMHSDTHRAFDIPARGNA